MRNLSLWLAILAKFRSLILLVIVAPLTVVVLTLPPEPIVEAAYACGECTPSTCCEEYCEVECCYWDRYENYCAWQCFICHNECFYCCV